jgi:hypothetical protein
MPLILGGIFYCEVASLFAEDYPFARLFLAEARRRRGARGRSLCLNKIIKNCEDASLFAEDDSPAGVVSR